MYLNNYEGMGKLQWPGTTAVHDLFPAYWDDSVAQWLERQPRTLEIAGSNPGEGSSAFSLKLADCLE